MLHDTGHIIRNKAGPALLVIFIWDCIMALGEFQCHYRFTVGEKSYFKVVFCSPPGGLFFLYKTAMCRSMSVCVCVCICVCSWSLVLTSGDQMKEKKNNVLFLLGSEQLGNFFYRSFRQ